MGHGANYSICLFENTFQRMLIQSFIQNISTFFLINLYFIANSIIFTKKAHEYDHRKLAFVR